MGEVETRGSGGKWRRHIRPTRCAANATREGDMAQQRFGCGGWVDFCRFRSNAEEKMGVIDNATLCDIPGSESQSDCSSFPSLTLAK